MHIQTREFSRVVTLPPQPNVVERPALENLHEEKDEPTDGNPADADQAGVAEPLLREDAQVEEKDGYFGEGQDSEVD